MSNLSFYLSCSFVKLVSVMMNGAYRLHEANSIHNFDLNIPWKHQLMKLKCDWESNIKIDL
jgi:hypothetical protein